MASPDNHPFVAASPQRVAEIEARAAALLRRRTQERFRELVLEWAARNEGAFPTPALADAQAREELEVLCRAIGRWAALTPAEVFPLGLLPVERLLASEEEWPP